MTTKKTTTAKSAVKKPATKSVAKPAAKKPAAKKAIAKTPPIKKAPTRAKKSTAKDSAITNDFIGSNSMSKDEATSKGLPWVAVLSVEIDPTNVGYGAFELDWNDKFLIQLTRAGYRGKDDNAIVDQWFNDVCRNVVMETYEQELANNPNYDNVVDIDQKRTK